MSPSVIDSAKGGQLTILTSSPTKEKQDPVVQSIVSLTSLLRGQLVKVFYQFMNKYTDFFIENLRKAFALLFTLFQQTYCRI